MNVFRLKEILKEKGISGKDLAKEVNVTEASISKLSKGDSIPRKDLLLKIAKTLDVDIKDLFNSTKVVNEPKEEIQNVINQLENLKDRL